MDIKCHVYNIPGVDNMRDLGGYKTKDGRVTAGGRFIRSAALAGIDNTGISGFKKLKIDCVIDLRSTLERKKSPDAVENNKSFHFSHIPMLDHIQSNIAYDFISSFPASIPAMYIDLLDNSALSFKAVFDLLADERFSCCLFHCTAGKDRTGLVTMLLLGLAGVDDETIIEDYSYTRHLLPLPEEVRKLGLPEYLFSSEPASMRETLGYVYKKYGSIPEYLERIGVDEGMRARIIAKLLQDDF